MKVGLFFGTFDPIHNGHLKIVNEVHKSGLVKKILFIVTPQSPFKVNNAITSFNHRVNMLNLAISDIPNLNYSRVLPWHPMPFGIVSIVLSSMV